MTHTNICAMIRNNCWEVAKKYIRGKGMEIIRERDIDFSNLKKLKCDVNSESRLYYDEDTIYKMFKNLSFKHLRRKQKKIELLSDGAVLNSVVMPNQQILKGFVLSGYTMDYINDSLPLFEFTRRSQNVYVFLQLVRRLSLSLKEIHNDPRNIIVGDLSFSNIIFDDDFKHYFVDFDSCMIDGISSDRICFLLSDYINKRGKYRIDINENTDRLSLILCTLYTIFLKQIDEISMYDFDMVADKVEMLKNMRNIVLEIKKYGKIIPDVPYLDEIIPITKIKKQIKI